MNEDRLRWRFGKARQSLRAEQPAAANRTQKQNGTVDMSIERKIHPLGSIRQPSPRGSRAPRRVRLQEIAALALVIAFGAMGSLRPSLISPMATGADPTAASALFKRN